jgi:hypothetical protein
MNLLDTAEGGRQNPRRRPGQDGGRAAPAMTRRTAWRLPWRFARSKVAPRCHRSAARPVVRCRARSDYRLRRQDAGNGVSSQPGAAVRHHTSVRWTIK